MALMVRYHDLQAKHMQSRLLRALLTDDLATARAAARELIGRRERVAQARRKDVA